MSGHAADMLPTGGPLPANTWFLQKPFTTQALDRLLARLTQPVAPSP
jgi:hypothetical protein